MATMAEAKRATGSKRQRPASMEVVETTPISRTIRPGTRIPSKRTKRSPYRAIHSFKRTFDYGSSGIVTDGVNRMRRSALVWATFGLHRTYQFV